MVRTCFAGREQAPVTSHLSLDSTLPPGFDKKTPREAGASGEGSILSSIGGTPQGVKNAFQALNTYTLEEASKDDSYPLPPPAVRALPIAPPLLTDAGVCWLYPRAGCYFCPCAGGQNCS